MADFATISQLIQEHQAEMIDLKFSDLFGRWQHVTLPAGTFSAEILSRGVPFDGSSVPGFKRAAGDDLKLLPDPATVRRDPFWEAPTLPMICQTAEADTGAWFDRDPRVIARRADELLQQSGFGSGSL